MATVFTLAGAFGSPTSVIPMLGGVFAEGNTVTPVPYDNWGIGTVFQLEHGAANLDAQLTTTSGQMVVLTHSLGSVAASYWLANYGPSSSVDPADVSFVLLGNSNRPYGGFCKDVDWFGHHADIPTDTPFTVTDFARQYDGWADWPGAAGTLGYAWINGLSGQGNVHPFYTDVSLDATTNSAYVVGNITYQWSLTWPCPMAGSTRQNANTANIDAKLRPDIEAGYSRPVSIPDPVYPNYYDTD